MLPNFLIIGAQKAGTSWFADNLGAHPDVFVAERELHYFNDRFERGIGWYESQFEAHEDAKAVGESTPGYMYHPEGPARVRQALGPDVRLIATLRHPVDRAYSAFWNALTSGRLPEDADFARTFREGDPFGIQSRGFYHTQLERVLEHFPRQSLLVFVQETDLRRGADTVRVCFEHLGVDPAFEPPRAAERANANRSFRAGHAGLMSLGRRVSRATARLPWPVRRALRATFLRGFDALPERRGYARLDPDLRRELMATYREDVERLEALLDRDLSVWREDADA